MLTMKGNKQKGHLSSPNKRNNRQYPHDKGLPQLFATARGNGEAGNCVTLPDQAPPLLPRPKMAN